MLHLNKLMKSNISILILISALVIVMFLNYTRVSKLERKLSIEQAKNRFILDQCNNNTTPYDSIYATDNTVAIYKNGILLSKTVTTTK